MTIRIWKTGYGQQEYQWRHCSMQNHVCVDNSCSRIYANRCYMGQHRPQAKSLLVDLKLQGFIN